MQMVDTETWLKSIDMEATMTPAMKRWTPQKKGYRTGLESLELCVVRRHDQSYANKG